MREGQLGGARTRANRPTMTGVAYMPNATLPAPAQWRTSHSSRRPAARTSSMLHGTTQRCDGR